MNDYHSLFIYILSVNNRDNISKNTYCNNKIRTIKLKSWYSNVTSLNNKLDALVIELNTNNVDVAIMTETWWTDTSLKVIKGYSTTT